jgi:hypothetical protein
LAIPFFNLQGQLVRRFIRLKPDNPRVERKNSLDGKEKLKPIKYESPLRKPGFPSSLPYFPPICLEGIRDRNQPLLITEGEKKSCAAAQLGFPTIGLIGVWGWMQKRPRDKNDRPHGPRELLPQLENVPWSGRVVYIVFDSDAVENSNIQLAERCLAEILRLKGVEVIIVRLPPGPIGGDGTRSKLGLDDFLCLHGKKALQDLLANSREYVSQFFSPLKIKEKNGHGEKLGHSSPHGGNLGHGIDGGNLGASKSLALGPAGQRIRSAANSAGRCPRAFTPLFQALEDPRRGLAWETGCRTLNCPVCRLRRICRWLNHFVQILSHQVKLFMWKGRVSEWPAKRRWLGRHNGKFLRVTGELSIVVSDVSVREGQPINPETALETLAEGMEKAKGRRPFSASRAWKMDEVSGKSRKYRCRGKVRCGGFPQLLAALDERGIRPTISEVNGGRMATWSAPEDWPDEQINCLYQTLEQAPIPEPQPRREVFTI